MRQDPQWQKLLKLRLKLEAAIEIHRDIAQVKTYDQMSRKLNESIEESFVGKKLRKD